MSIHRIHKKQIALLITAVFFSSILSQAAFAFDFPPWDKGHTGTRGQPGSGKASECPCSPPGAPNPCYQGSPIYVKDGNYLYRTTDLLIPGRIQLEISRAYNSKDNFRTGLFGYGWVFNYEYRVLEIEDPKTGKITATLLVPNGQRYEFVRNKDGTYTPPRGIYHILTKKGDGTFVYRETGGTKFTFDPAGNLASIIDRNGNALTFAYESGVLVSITDGAGRGLTFQYGPHGKISSITDPAGRVFSYEYGGEGNLIKYIDPMGGITQYAYYSGDHNLRSITDPRGNQQIALTYDAYGRVSTYSDENGETWTYTYVSATETRKRDSAGNTWRFIFNSDGAITTEIDPLGGTLTRAFDAKGNPTSVTDQNGHITRYEYDEQGNTTKITDPLGNTTSFVYEPVFNKVTSFTDPNGNTTTFEYDNKGDFIRMIDPLGFLTSLSYNTNGDLVSLTDINGNTFNYTYDGSGNLTELNDGTHPINISYDILGRLTNRTESNGTAITFDYDDNGNVLSFTTAEGTTQFTYDENGNITARTNANGKTETFVYDVYNNLIKKTDPSGNIASYTYDLKGNLTSVTDANGNTTTYTYDILHRLVKVISAVGGETKYTYDAVGNLLTITDPNNNTTTFKYDSGNRFIKLVSPDTGTTQYTYDSNGNMHTKTDANGLTTTYQYDGLDRLTSINFPDPSDDIAYIYDTCPNGKGRLCEMRDSSGVMSYQYNKMGQIVKKSKVIDNITYTTEYNYDPRGNLNAITYPDGRIVSYTYTANRIDSVTTTKNGISKSIVSNIAYSSTSMSISMTYGNGIKRAMTYDSRDLLASLNIEGISRLSYTRDNIGNITSITDALNPSKTYAYDGLNRLTQANGPWGGLSYSYDAVGNRQTETTDTGVSNYSYSANRLMTITGEKNLSFSYDANGNPITENARQYLYNQNQRLAKIVENGAILGEYTYNGKGQRVKKLTDGQTTIFHYDIFGQLIAESGSNGGITTEYVYLYGEPIAKIENDNVSFYHNNHLAAPQVMTDEGGQIVWKADYTPFGQADVSSSTITNNLRVPGQYYDDGTGLHYNFHRYYKPGTGRYLTPDPIGLEGGVNLYSYVINNPVNLVDFFGLDWIEYTGEQLVYYEGNYGDTSKPKETCKATSGLPGYQLKKYQERPYKNIGPIPEDDYTVNLVPDPNRIAQVDPNTGDLIRHPQGGIERIPSVYYLRRGGRVFRVTYEPWGTWRARLQAKKGAYKYGRGLSYLHNSRKGYTHGCVETCNKLLNLLLEYRKQGNNYIDVRVNYTDPTTYGGTDKPPYE